MQVLTFSGLWWLLGLQNVLIGAQLSSTKVLLHWQKVLMKLSMWIASLPSAFQTIRCLGIWMSILLVNSWGLDHVSKFRGCPKYFKCAAVAFLEGNSRDLCWPGHGVFILKANQGLLYWVLIGLFSQKVFGKMKFSLTQSDSWKCYDGSLVSSGFSTLLLKGQGILSQFLYQWVIRVQSTKQASLLL